MMAGANSNKKVATSQTMNGAVGANTPTHEQMCRSPAQMLAQTLFSLAKAEVKRGGDYMPRIRGHRSYHEAMGLISNVDEIVAKAERVMAKEVMEPEIEEHYRELAESYWQRHNFDIPVMRKNRVAEANESMEMTRTYLNAVYPALFAAYMEEVGENGFRRQYARSLYRVEKERAKEWWGRNPITYRFGGKTPDIKAVEGRIPVGMVPVGGKAL